MTSADVERGCDACREIEPLEYRSNFTGQRYCGKCGWRITDQLRKDKLVPLQPLNGTHP